MKIDLEDKFGNLAIRRGGCVVYAPTDAVQLVKEAKSHLISILGVDAFWLGEKSIQPSMEHSADFSRSSSKWVPEKAHDRAIEIMEQNRKYGLFYEIVLGDRLEI